MQLSSDQDRILLAEDCPDTQKVLQFMLEQTGAEVVIVNDGQECVERAQQEEFQLVVMDIKMPKMDGVQALTQLRGEGYSHPVVALTASPSEHIKDQMLALGVEAFLSKLSDRKNIVSTVTEILKRRETKIVEVDTGIPLPILAIYPESMPQSHDEHVRLLHFLDKVRTVDIKLRRAISNRSTAKLDSYINELGSCSLYGYQILASQLESLSECLSKNNDTETLKHAAVVERVLLGILAGQDKIEKKAEVKGLQTDSKPQLH